MRVPFRYRAAGLHRRTRSRDLGSARCTRVCSMEGKRRFPAVQFAKSSKIKTIGSFTEALKRTLKRSVNFLAFSQETPSLRIQSCFERKDFLKRQGRCFKIQYIFAL